MKITKNKISKILITWSLFSVLAFSCHITMTPKILKLKIGTVTNIDVHIKWEHRRCELDDDDVNVDYVGVKKIKINEWEKVKKGLYINNITFKVTEKTAFIRVWRECSKKGLSEGFISLGVIPSDGKLKKHKHKKKKHTCDGDCSTCK